jgi:dTDP-4-amino-4,6-dideoxygalactose transaminase
MFIKDFSPWPSFSDEEINAVNNVLKSNKVNYWTGKECKEFENEFSIWSKSKYSISLANGTVALEIALDSLKIRSGDEVIVTSRTFIASISAIIKAGAIPVFADIDSESQNISAKSVSRRITKNTKAIVCVHLAGWPCDMDDIMQIAKSHGLSVIEDCAQAHGAMYKGRAVGSIGHVGCWSFCQDKIMTTGGEGGMITTNDELLWKHMWALKDHGKSYDKVNKVAASEGYRWLHDSFGSNYRMTEMQAAIGRIQLKRMNEWHSKRLANANKIWQVAKKCIALRVPILPKYIEHAAYKCYVFVKPFKLRSDWNRDRIMKEINNLGIPCFSGSCSEVYLENAFNDTDFRPKERLPVAKELGETSLMFLVHPTLTNNEIDKTCNIILEVMKLASKSECNE